MTAVFIPEHPLILYIVFLPRASGLAPSTRLRSENLKRGALVSLTFSTTPIRRRKMAESSLVGIAKLSAGWAIALSVLLILAGILAIVVPPVAGIGVAIVVAWLVLLGGVVHLAIAWHIRGTGGMVWELLVGLLYIAVAVYMLVWPVAGLASLTLLLACYLFAKGVLVLILAFRIRHHSGAG